MQRIYPLIALLIFCLLSSHTQATETWQPLKKGLAFGSFPTDKQNISILRIDPKYWQFSIRSSSESKEGHNMSARQWAEKHAFTAAINAGMFHLDHEKHVGYLKQQTHINSPKINAYPSVLGLEPYNPKHAAVTMIDTDAPQQSIQHLIKNYRYVVQNLRLIKSPRINRWHKKKKAWREAALGIDTQGRVLFIYSPSPYSMHDFNALLLSFNIDLRQAQHLEGGLQAQLFINSQQFQLQKLSPSQKKHITQHQQPLGLAIPFVIGIQERK